MRIHAAVLVLAILPLDSFASSFSVDVSDLWWNPSESGWGINLIQEADIAFGTLFVYGPDGRAHWYAAPDLQGSAGSSLDTASFNGGLYETTGPAFSAAFDPAQVSVRQVGTLSFALQSPSSGVLTYSVDGTTVQKTVTRQTWRTNNVNGQFVGTRVFRGFHCTPDAPVTQGLGVMDVAQSGSSLQIVTTNGNPSCTFNGDYSQAGRMGLSSGSYVCNDGTSGSYRMQEIEVTPHAFSARLDTTIAACQLLGHIAGVRADVQLPPG